MSLAISRRAFLAGSSSVFAFNVMPGVSLAGDLQNKRFLTIVLRGGLDGLSAVAPVGDPDYERSRGGLVIPRSALTEQFTLDGTFALNPSLPNLAALYRKGEALIVHAVATPYRERSHFDGQDILESGYVRPGNVKSGWMNRLISAMPHARQSNRQLGFAAGSGVPLIMRGTAGVVTWAPPGTPATSADTRARLLDIYNHAAPELASVFEAGIDLEGISGDAAASGMSMGSMLTRSGSEKLAKATAQAAGSLLGAADGPRIGAIDLQGFDTHIKQTPLEGQLAGLLSRLDGVIAELHQSMAQVWKDTVIVLVTEFGRTVHMNGTSGTDHGVGTVAILLGGAVNGGRVITDWPGLSQRALYEGRDLMPTTDLRAVLKGAVVHHLDIPENLLSSEVFPESGGVKPMRDLVRA